MNQNLSLPSLQLDPTARQPWGDDIPDALVEGLSILREALKDHRDPWQDDNERGLVLKLEKVGHFGFSAEYESTFIELFAHRPENLIFASGWSHIKVASQFTRSKWVLYLTFREGYNDVGNPTLIELADGSTSGEVAKAVMMSIASEWKLRFSKPLAITDRPLAALSTHRDTLTIDIT